MRGAKDALRCKGSVEGHSLWL